MLNEVKNKVTSKVGRQILQTKKHSPVVMFGVGVAGFIAFGVLTARATLKLDDVLREAEETEAKFQEALRLSAEGKTKQEYTDEDEQKDRKLVKLQLAIKIAGLYAPAVGVGLLTIGAFTGSHIVLSRRNAGLSAAYAAIHQGFREYRSRVIADVGEDKDREYFFDLVDKEIAVETDEGPVVKTVKRVRKGTKSPYAACFDESNPNWRPGFMENPTFISVQQTYANDRLHAVGHLMLNDVYRSLGLQETTAGAVVGWVRGNGDNRVNFGVFRGDTFMGDLFAMGEENSVWLDFNVDGEVYKLIDKNNKDKKHKSLEEDPYRDEC